MFGGGCSVGPRYYCALFVLAVRRIVVSQRSFSPHPSLILLVCRLLALWHFSWASSLYCALAITSGPSGHRNGNDSDDWPNWRPRVREQSTGTTRKGTTKHPATYLRMASRPDRTDAPTTRPKGSVFCRTWRREIVHRTGLRTILATAPQALLLTNAVPDKIASLLL